MKQYKCSECGQWFSEPNTKCPNCGCPVDEKTQYVSDNGQTPQKMKRQASTFEIVCYVLAGIFAVLFLLQETSSGSYVNFDGSNKKLIWEIAAFSWLIVGRLTALINK